MMQKSFAYWPEGQFFRAHSIVRLEVMQLDQYENIVCPKTFRFDSAHFNGTIYRMSGQSGPTPLPGVKVSVAGPTSGIYDVTWLMTEASDYSVSITGLVQASGTYYSIPNPETDMTFSILPSKVSLEMQSYCDLCF